MNKKIKTGTELSSYDKTVRAIFADIVSYYDKLNTILSFGQDSRWRKKLVSCIRPFPSSARGVVLDLAAGTLEVSAELLRQHPELQIIAVDFCKPMLVHGKNKIKDYAKNRILSVVGDARCIPLHDNTVDTVTMSFGLRNVKPRQVVIAEALRVLVPGGKFCVLEFGSAQDKIMFGAYNIYLRYVLPFFGRLISKRKGAYEHLADSVESFPSADALKEEMLAVGFKNVNYKKYTAGIVCIHVGIKA